MNLYLSTEEKSERLTVTVQENLINDLRIWLKNA